MQSTTTASITVTPQTGKQLAEIYGVGIKTFNQWIKPFKDEIGNKVTRYYTIAQVKIIYQCLGIPGTTVKE